MFICLMPHTPFLELLTHSKAPSVPQFPQLEDKEAGLNDFLRVSSGPEFLETSLAPAPPGNQNQLVRILGQERGQRGYTCWTGRHGHCPERCWLDAERAESHALHSGAPKDPKASSNPKFHSSKLQELYS